MAIVFVGIDLAKNVFAVHGVDELGKQVLVRSTVPRARLHELIANLPPCTVAMEACSGTHHWARLFAGHGHCVRLIAPKFVTPYRMAAPGVRPTRPMRRRSARPCSARPCASCRSRASSSRVT